MPQLSVHGARACSSLLAALIRLIIHIKIEICAALKLWKDYDTVCAF